MSRDPASLAKITRPRVGHVVERRRLFTVLDRARRRPVIWLSGPLGAGKTTLVTSYLAARGVTTLWYHVDEGDEDVATFFYYLSLGTKRLSRRRKRPLPICTPEYFLGLSTFARRYFEEMYARLTPPFAVVLDNVQEARNDSRFYEVIEAGVAAVPEGGTLMLLSRDPPPKGWAGLRASQRLAQIGWDQLRLTEVETGRLLRLHRTQGVSREEVAALHARTGGWPAGVVLLLEEARGEAASEARGGELEEWANQTPQVVFDYFAGELFDRLPEAKQDFLLRVALLPGMTASLATALTGRADAGKLLAELADSHYFTDRHVSQEPLYRFHPLFREFLLHRGEEGQNVEVRARLRHRAASLLEEAGQEEAAVALYQSAGAWGELALLICAEAPSLMAQGREETLARWIDDLPEGLVEAVPRLCYWLGVCRLPRNPPEAQGLFEAAFDGLAAEEDRGGCLLAWVGVVQAIIHAGHDLSQLDPWIERMAALASVGLDSLTSETETRVISAMLGALWLRRPDHPEIAEWVARAYRVLQTDHDLTLRTQTGFYLAILHLWQGAWAEAKRVVDGLRDSAGVAHAPPLVRILWNIIECHVRWYGGEREISQHAIADGLEIAHHSGVHLWDFALLDVAVVEALGAGDVAGVAESLRRMGALVNAGGRRLEQAFYCRNVVWEATLRKDLLAAIRSGERAVRLGTEVGSPFLDALNRYVLAQALLATGEGREAAAGLRRVRQMGERYGSPLLSYMVDLAEAQVAFGAGRDAVGEEHLRRGLKLGGKNGYTVFIGFCPMAMADLCVRALEAGIEVAQAQGLVRRCRLIPSEPPVAVEAWPWPIRVYTLGRFAVECGGEPLRFPGKTQRRPLELLRALIAFGGRDVSETQLVDALWPDAEGDAAHRALATTLHRLRKLLGHDGALELREGRLSLNPYVCWVDVWACETLLAGAEQLGQEGEQGGPAVQRIERGLALYEGSFLVGEQAPWVLPTRERLRTRFLQAIAAVGRHWERDEGWERAIVAYQEGLEVDDLAERLYYQMMCCYQRLGRHGDAARVYRRCRQALVSVLGVEPSAETEQLYQRLRA